MEALRQLEPWHLAVVAGLVASLACVWAAWITRRVLRMGRDAQWQRNESRRLTTEVRSLQNQIGWDDNMAKTQHLDPAVMEKFRKRTSP